MLIRQTNTKTDKKIYRQTEIYIEIQTQIGLQLERHIKAVTPAQNQIRIIKLIKTI